MSEHKNIEKFTQTALPAAMAGLLLAACASGGEATPASETTATTQITQEGVYEVTSESNETAQQAIPLYIDASRLGFSTEESQQKATMNVETELGLMTYAPFARVDLQDDKLVLTDSSPDGMKPEDAAWFTARVAALEEPVKEALKGNIDSIVFALDERESSDIEREAGYVYGYLDVKNKQAVFEISPDAGDIEPEFIEQYLTHEVVGHGLFSSASVSSWSKSEASPEVQREFASACANLREAALEGVKYNLQTLEPKLRQISELAPDPVLRQRYDVLADSVRNGDWITLQPTPETASPDASTEQVLPECSVSSIGRMAKIGGDMRALGDPKDGAAANAPEQMYALMDDANVMLGNVIGDMSLYRLLTESQYQYDSEVMGHPHDGVDELAASTLNVTISYPEDFARNLQLVSQDDREAILEVVRLTIDQTAQAHPKLRGYLSDREAVFMEALNR